MAYKIQIKYKTDEHKRIKAYLLVVEYDHGRSSYVLNGIYGNSNSVVLGAFLDKDVAKAEVNVVLDKARIKIAELRAVPKEILDIEVVTI